MIGCNQQSCTAGSFKGTFQFPFADTGRKEIAAWELAVLLEGIDLSRGRRRKRYSLPGATPSAAVPEAEKK